MAVWGSETAIVPRGTIWERGRVGHFVKRNSGKLLIQEAYDLPPIRVVCALAPAQKS
jgi:hypothetical protein